MPDPLSNAEQRALLGVLAGRETDPVASARPAGREDVPRARQLQFSFALIAARTSGPSFPRRVVDAVAAQSPDRRSLAARIVLARFIREAMVPSEHCRIMAASR